MEDIQDCIDNECCLHSACDVTGDNAVSDNVAGDNVAGDNIAHSTVNIEVNVADAVAQLLKYFPEDEIQRRTVHADGAKHIATRRAEELKNRKDEDDEELNKMYSMLIPGYKNESAVRVICFAALIYDIGLSNSRLAEIFNTLNYWEVDNAIFIAYHAKSNMDGASVYREACNIVLQACTASTPDVEGEPQAESVGPNDSAADIAIMHPVAGPIADTGNCVNNDAGVPAATGDASLVVDNAKIEDPQTAQVDTN